MIRDRAEPMIIQGGMGAAVSAWTLARAVSETGQLGVVSGTALDVILCRRLQLGDPGGHLRRAMEEFPFPAMAQRVLDRYFVPGGKSVDAPHRSYPLPSADPSLRHQEVLVVANFVEVYLAKEGHDGLVGVNYLEKIQLPTLPSIFGAMLAGVDYVLMGAGIPRAIPGILDRLSRGERVELVLDVDGADRGDRFVTQFDPGAFCAGRASQWEDEPRATATHVGDSTWSDEGAGPFLHRPKFLAIIASATLATVLTRKSTGRVDGFIVEGPTAGGHNAPPRGVLRLTDQGEPIYGDRDVVDLKAIGALGLPFWLAGEYGTPERLVEALDAGATGVQVGTPFAYCDESGLRRDIKDRVLAMSREGRVSVFTDPVASPTGFPFKVVRLEETISEPVPYAERTRVCDLGYLRHAYKRPDGSLGWRCPSEKVDAYMRKGGDAANTRGRKCVCNGLLANVGLGQTRRDGTVERPLVTSGDDACQVARLLPTPTATSYKARNVVEYLLTGVETTCVVG